jgi:hypothetical protein
LLRNETKENSVRPLYTIRYDTFINEAELLAHHTPFITHLISSFTVIEILQESGVCKRKPNCFCYKFGLGDQSSGWRSFWTRDTWVFVRVRSLDRRLFMLIARGEGWLVRQSVEDDLGIPTKIGNASMSGDEVIIHHSHARCGTTWRMGQALLVIYWKHDRHGLHIPMDDRETHCIPCW